MSRVALLSVATLLATLLGCAASNPEPSGEPAPTGDNSRVSLDWEGVYSGIVPCADCPGIRTRIELRGDGSYSRSLVYLERDVAPVTDSGRFVWDDSGSRIALGADRQQFLVGENVLIHLDRDGQRITGPNAAAYRLEKTMHDPRIENRRWQLVELNGRPIEAPEGREGPYLELDAAQARVTGNASCNRFFGTYELTAGDRIRFGPDMGSTMMACPELEREREFLEALARVDNYTLGEGELSLNRARMAPLARLREIGGGSASAR